MNSSDVNSIVKKWRGRAAGKDIQKLVDYIKTLEKDLENTKNSLKEIAYQPQTPNVSPSGLHFGPNDV